MFLYIKLIRPTAICTLLLVILCSSFVLSAQKDYTQYADPMVGTGGHGHTFPGAIVPFGMVQLSPDTRLGGWDGCSGYHYSDSVIYGFSHTHLSGTGCLDYGDILVMPTVGKVKLTHKAYRSHFSHQNEKATPGYYSVLLDQSRIKAELTVGKRTGWHKYTFPKSGQANIILDMNHRDRVKSAEINVTSDRELTGHRCSSSWSDEQHVYFVMQFSKPFKKSGIYKGGILSAKTKHGKGIILRSFVTFDTQEGEAVYVKVGISAVSIEGARKNLEADQAGWDFDKVALDAKQEWNKELSKIEIESKDNSVMRTFYSAMYHVMTAPYLYQDADGKYRGMDRQIHETKNFEYYTVFSIWDTYRALHPLLALIDRKRTSDIVNTFVTQYQQGGLLPVWELGGRETSCMIGYHSVSVINDAFQKGIMAYDTNAAYEAVKRTATATHHDMYKLRPSKSGLEIISLFRYAHGWNDYQKHGYIRRSRGMQSVSKTLEYAYDDWCIAQMAKKMGKLDDYQKFNKRAEGYKYHLDSISGFMKARNKNFVKKFDPTKVTIDYVEGNAWQWSFYVPHDISGQMSIIGGKERLSRMLDSLFAASTAVYGYKHVDVSGLIGQYAHGNEPSHQIAYEYDYTGQPWKTQAMTRRVMNELYRDQPNGLEGNDDCGQMSAWYVFSALGFYPVCPGSEDYAIGSPLVDKAVIHLENGKQFVIHANGNDKANVYIGSAKLNGATYNKSYIKYKDIAQGGDLEFNMAAEPNKNWGSDVPVSKIEP